MQKITSVDGLKKAIQSLEVEQAEKGKLLKEQFYFTCESFKPANLITSTLNDIARSPYLAENILGAAIGLLSGFYSKKLMLNSTGNKLKRLFGVVLQYGVTNLVAHHKDTIISIGHVLFQHLILRKKKTF